MRLTWTTADPAGLRRWLATIGLAVREDGRILLRGGVVGIAAADGSFERLQVATLAEPAGSGREESPDAAWQPQASWPLIRGVGWATVDAERLAAGPLETLPDEPALTAAAWRSPGDVEPATILLEPIGEGLLAAALARHGEGPVCLWLRGSRPTARARLRPLADGPLGAARMAEPRSRWGPFLFLIER